MQSWQALTTWEKNGGRTIHWSISTALARHFNLDAIVGGLNLTADLSYPFFHPVGCFIEVEGLQTTRRHKCVEDSVTNDNNTDEETKRDQ
jgi:hypothetical protein